MSSSVVLDKCHGLMSMLNTLANSSKLHVHERLPPTKPKLQRPSLACVFLVTSIALGISPLANWFIFTRVTHFICIGL